jgi:hypothetical protein
MSNVAISPHSVAAPKLSPVNPPIAPAVSRAHQERSQQGPGDKTPPATQSIAPIPAPGKTRQGAKACQRAPDNATKEKPLIRAPRPWAGWFQPQCQQRRRAAPRRGSRQQASARAEKSKPLSASKNMARRAKQGSKPQKKT